MSPPTRINSSGEAHSRTAALSDIQPSLTFLHSLKKPQTNCSLDALQGGN